MGGRGSSSGGKGSSGGAIGKSDPIELYNEKHRSSGGHWKSTILEASVDKAGNLTLQYATPYSYENPNKNTTYANYKLNAGVYNQTGDRELKSHNINWDKVKSVSGNTYDVKDYIKELGFKKWDRENKRWVRQ